YCRLLALRARRGRPLARAPGPRRTKDEARRQKAGGGRQPGVAAFCFLTVLRLPQIPAFRYLASCFLLPAFCLLASFPSQFPSSDLESGMLILCSNCTS